MNTIQVKLTDPHTILHYNTVINGGAQIALAARALPTLTRTIPSLSKSIPSLSKNIPSLSKNLTSLSKNVSKNLTSLSKNVSNVSKNTSKNTSKNVSNIKPTELLESQYNELLTDISNLKKKYENLSNKKIKGLNEKLITYNAKLKKDLDHINNIVASINDPNINNATKTKLESKLIKPVASLTYRMSKLASVIILLEKLINTN